MLFGYSYPHTLCSALNLPPFIYASNTQDLNHSIQQYLEIIIADLTFRHAIDPGALTAVGDTHYGWIEYADYFGIITLVYFFTWWSKDLKK